jgi:hypothetical protein
MVVNTFRSFLTLPTLDIHATCYDLFMKFLILNKAEFASKPGDSSRKCAEIVG